MADDNKVEIELAIRDSMSVALKQMAKSLSDTKDKAVESTKHITTMDTAMGGLAKSLHGPFGAIAGVTALGVAAGQVILNFAQSRAQLNLFADTSRLSTREVTALRNTMELAGVPIKEATGYISSMTGAFRDMWMNKWGSRAAEQAKAYGDVTVESIGRVMEAVKGGDFSAAFSQSLEEIRKTAPQHRAKMAEFYSQVLGVPAPILEKLVTDHQAALDKVTAMNDKAAQKVHEIWTGWMQKLEKTWEGSINSMIRLMDQIISNPEKALESAKRGWKKGWEGGKGGGRSLTDDELRTLREQSEIEGKGTQEVPLPRARPMPGQEGDKPMSLKQLLFGMGDELNLSAKTHSSGITQEQIKLSEETNAILIEMRNLMKEGGGGIMYGTGIRSDTMAAGVGGFRPGGGTGKSGANFMGSARAQAAGIRGGVGQNLVTVQTAAGPITVNKEMAGDLAGAVNDLVEAGAPVGKVGSYSNRNIAGTNTPSQHSMGNALDLFNQSGRGIISKEGMAWLLANPEKWKEIKRRRNLVGGEEFGDIGHVEGGGPGFGEKHYGDKLDADAKKSINDRKAGGNASDQQIEAFKRVRAAAAAAGSPLPDLTAAIAMHESGWFGRGGVFEKSGGTNPFGQTGVGPMGSVVGRDAQKHAVYGSLEEGVAAHMARWGAAYADTPEKTLSNMVKRGYNTTDPAWSSKIDRALSVGSGGSKGTISAEVNFKNVWPGVSTRADTAGEIFEKLKVNNLKQSPRADSTTSDPYPWAMSN